MFSGRTSGAEKGAEMANINEGDRPVVKAIAKAVSKAVGRVPAASGGGGTAKGNTSTGEARVGTELQCVQRQNEELHERLVELTVGFKQVEESQEALDGGLANLERP